MLSALVLLVVAGLWMFLPGADVSPQHITARIRARVKASDAVVRESMHTIRERSRELAALHGAGKDLPPPLPHEALVELQEGRIHWYYGSITVSPAAFSGGDTDWGLERRGERIFMMVDAGDELRYVAPLMEVTRGFIPRIFGFPLALHELAVLRNPSPGLKSHYAWDEVSGVYHVSEPLAAAEGRLVLNIKVIHERVVQYLRQRRLMQAAVPACLALVLILIGLARCHASRAIGGIAIISLVLALAAVYLAAPWSRGSLLIQIGNLSLVSVFQVLALSLWLLFPAFAAARRRFPPRMAVLLADGALIVAVWGGSALIQRVSFHFGSFSLQAEFLALVLTLFLWQIFAFPLLQRTPFGEDFLSRAGLLGFQALLVILVAWARPPLLLPFAVTAATVPVMLMLRRGIFRRVLAMGLVALSIFFLTTSRDEANKKEFITDNLRHIFLNQGNYAKLIAREIVHEINMTGSDLSTLFSLEGETTLRDLWRNTLAARESIPSSISVLSPALQVTRQFSHQIPYVSAERPRTLPVWAVEDVRARLYGREIDLARASIAVYRQGIHLGYVVIQVLNSPELILRQQDERNIFALDPRLGPTPMNYIKLNRDREILENPGQINIQDISGLFRHDGRWVRFRHENARFAGYVFTGGADPIMIYYRLPSTLGRLAGWVRLLLLFLGLSFLPALQTWTAMRWVQLTHSFSARVFVTLVLIVLSTGVIFSLFSLNFHRNSLQQERVRHVFEQGQTAQNIVDGMLDEDDEISRNQVFFLSRMMNADVTVFRRGERELTSDIRQILGGRIPEYMDSGVMDLLTLRNQKFVLRRDGDIQTVYFRNGELVFRLDFSDPWPGLSGGGDSYADFIMVMVFFMGLVGMAVAVFFRDRILDPIRTINQGMAEVETGGLPRLEPLPREHELRQLYNGFNKMIRGIAAQKRNISEISRMKTLVDLGRRVAHEVKNPLTPIQLSAEQIRRSLEDKRENFEETIRKSVDFIVDETEHLRKVSYGFLDLSRLDTIEAGEFNLDELIAEEVHHFSQVYANIIFKLDLAVDHLTVRLDAVKIRQMVKNILSNSVEAMAEGPGEIRVSLRRDGSDVELIFEDNGSGMDPAEVERVFEMDYSTKESGTGLGMFIIHRIVDLHGGRLRVESRLRQGTRMHVTLPVNVESRE